MWPSCILLCRLLGSFRLLLFPFLLLFSGRFLCGAHLRVGACLCRSRDTPNEAEKREQDTGSDPFPAFGQRFVPRLNYDKNFIRAGQHWTTDKPDTRETCGHGLPDC
jgi:hypothetical protein